MAKTYTLRRVIPEAECPGTCCKMTGVFPVANGTRCVHFNDRIPGRPFGGCPFFNLDNSLSEEHARLSVQDKEKFRRGCHEWPVPDSVPQLDVPYDMKFGQEFHPACECFEWEEIDGP